MTIKFNYIHTWINKKTTGKGEIWVCPWRVRLEAENQLHLKYEVKRYLNHYKGLGIDNLEISIL